MNRETRREVVATLLKAGRKDLARRFVQAKEFVGMWEKRTALRLACDPDVSNADSSAGRRDLAEQFALIKAQRLNIKTPQSFGDEMALTSYNESGGTHVFKFTSDDKRGGYHHAMFTVMVGPSGLLSTKNTQGTPPFSLVYKATDFVKKQLKEAGLR